MTPREGYMRLTVLLLVEEGKVVDLVGVLDLVLRCSLLKVARVGKVFPELPAPQLFTGLGKLKLPSLNRGCLCGSYQV